MSSVNTLVATSDSVFCQCRQLSYVTASSSVSTSYYVSTSPSLLFGFPPSGVMMHKLPIFTPGVYISTLMAASPLVVSLYSSMGVLSGSSKVSSSSNCA